jgi:hypothetical protein
MLSFNILGVTQKAGPSPLGFNVKRLIPNETLEIEKTKVKIEQQGFSANACAAFCTLQASKCADWSGQGIIEFCFHFFYCLVAIK